MLHRRAGAVDRAGSARVPPQDHGEDPKNLAVLNAVAEKIGWGKPAPTGVFRGLAQMMAFGSYVAGAAEVSVDGDKIKIHRIVGGDRSGLCRQSGADRAAGRGLVRVRAVGAVLRRDHRQGRLHRADQLRHLQLDAHRRDAEGRVDHHAVRRAWGGVGEPTIVVAAPAVLNAYFEATGKRIRSFPLKNHDLQIACIAPASIARQSARKAAAASAAAAAFPAPGVRAGRRAARSWSSAAASAAQAAPARCARPIRKSP